MATWKKTATPKKMTKKMTKIATPAAKAAATSGLAMKKIQKASKAPAVQKARPIATGGTGTTRPAAKTAVSGMSMKKAAPKAAPKIIKPSANKKLY